MLKKMNLILAIIFAIALSGCDKKTDVPTTGMNPNYHNLPSDVQTNLKEEVESGNSTTSGDNDSPSVTGDDVPEYTGERNPVADMDLNGPDDITPEIAQKLFNGLGLMGEDSYHHLSYADSMAAFCVGATGRGESSLSKSYSGPTNKGCKGIGLDSQIAYRNGASKKSLKAHLFKEYELLKKALIKYKDYPEISFEKTPVLMENAIQKASQEFTAVNPQAKRIRLMKALMGTESGQTHWKNFRPVASQTAAFGVGQFIPSSADWVKINPYDPEENMLGTARLLNKHLNGSCNGNLHCALKNYNGSGEAAERYATGILNRI
ncbi:MAG: hypothetical protein COB02_10160 [Candidatus Cloacimonadota bacterium]|nr:MAG: hypothetical protein COB02_10160 [Candidatus Cloacimonadota bacterium]